MLITQTNIIKYILLKRLLLIFNIFSESQHIWMCPIIRLQCSVIDLLQSYNYCILFFIYWIDLLKVRVYIFYFTMYYKLLQFFFKEIGAKFFLLSFLLMIGHIHICWDSLKILKIRSKRFTLTNLEIQVSILNLNPLFWPL
jgi:hypothetical protein